MSRVLWARVGPRRQHDRFRLGRPSGGEMTRRGAAAPGSTPEMFERLYMYLCCVARTRIQQYRPVTILPDELVHEAFVRVSTDRNGHPLLRRWASEDHFIRVVSLSMRSALVDLVRRAVIERELARFGYHHIDWGRDAPRSRQDVLSVEEFLRFLRRRDERYSGIVFHRYCIGGSVNETAVAMSLSPRKVKRECARLREALARRLECDGREGP